MFGRKAKKIADLEYRIDNLGWDLKFAKEKIDRGTVHIRQAWNENKELRALNEKLYNAIDKKNEKLRAMAYKFQNPGTDFEVPVPGEFKESK